jgi:hypothetical protein
MLHPATARLGVAWGPGTTKCTVRPSERGVGDERASTAGMDDEPRELDELRGPLRRRYGQEYLVLCESSVASALDRLAELAADGRPVAMMGAPATMIDTGGGEFLATAHRLHPSAKRVLIVPRGVGQQVSQLFTGHAEGDDKRQVVQQLKRCHRSVLLVCVGAPTLLVSGAPASVQRSASGHARSGMHRCHMINPSLCAPLTSSGLYGRNPWVGATLISGIQAAPLRRWHSRAISMLSSTATGESCQTASTRH